MTEQKKDGRGSGSKKNVGRKKLTYETKTVYKKVPEEIGKSEIAVLRQENIRLKNTLDTIRKDFIPEAPKRKRTFRGNNPNK